MNRQAVRVSSQQRVPPLWLERHSRQRVNPSLNINTYLLTAAHVISIPIHTTPCLFGDTKSCTGRLGARPERRDSSCAGLRVPVPCGFLIGPLAANDED